MRYAAIRKGKKNESKLCTKIVQAINSIFSSVCFLSLLKGVIMSELSFACPVLFTGKFMDQ
jgi:hypothetical protein